MRLIKQKKKRHSSFLLKIAVLALMGSVVVALVNQQIQISQKRQELDDINQQIRVQDVENDQLRKILEDESGQDSDYMERYARENLGYAKAGERVFITYEGN